MPSIGLHDTRLLTNLIKTEKDALISFKAWSKDAASASSALSAWSVADSGDTQDLMDVSFRLSQLLTTCTESQRSYIHALSAYRACLKDVLERESSLKTVIRDREILVNRLIKLGNKKPADSALESHQGKVEDAQRELTACESFLQQEEAAISAVKRRSYREALAMRMKAMGRLGQVMEDSANEAVAILEALGGGDDEYYPSPYQNGERDDADSVAGDSITPSHSASQAALSRASSSASLYDDRGNGALSPIPLPNHSGAPRDRQLSPGSPRAMSPNRAMSPSSPRPLSPTPGRERRASAMSNSTIPARSPPRSAPPPPRPIPIMAPVPTAPRPVSSYLQSESTDVPGFDIPKAPTNVMTRVQEDDSSDEDDARGYEVHQGLSANQRSSHYPLDSPSVVGGGGSPAKFRRKAMSDSSSIHGDTRKRRGSFFGGLASLFKKKEKNPEAKYDVGGGGWDTRTDRNIYSAQRANGMVGSGSVSGLGMGRRRNDDDSDDDGFPTNTVRVVNDPKLRKKAMSDLGVSTRPQSVIRTQSANSAGLKKKKKRESTRAASDIGVSPAAPSTKPKSTKSVAPPMPTSPLLPPPIMAPVPTAPTRQSGAFAPLEQPPPLVTPSSPVPVEATGESPSVTKKKKKKVKDPSETVVLSAESLGIPAAVAKEKASQSLSRSNTVTTNGTTATGTRKKKKRAPVEEVFAIPTAADLSSTLPSANRVSYIDSMAPLPLPSDSPQPSPKLGSAPRVAQVAEEAPPSRSATPPVGEQASKAPLMGAQREKRSKRESMLHGTGNWVAPHDRPHHAHPHPPPPKSAARNAPKPVEEGDESLLAIVDRVEGLSGEAQTSRKYGDIGVADPTPGRLTVPRLRPHNPNSDPSPQRRKSVRMADGPDDAVAVSPPSSIRSDPHSSSSQPPRGILVHHAAEQLAAASVAGGAGSGWETRATAATYDDSSDEDGGDYKQARKAFGRATKSMENVMEGRFTKAEKGKGKAVEQ
ncbi:hypothetical protein MNV49_006025 [Pseudohyphozyma bogoriensis]|nr:hypothetical protein MNV49_006025 [Pseudohyphozyma bogoriensis]